MTRPTMVVPVPEGWGLTSYAIHFEGESLANDPKPFAANVLVQLRTDVRAGILAAQVAADDLRAVREAVPGIEVVSVAPLALTDRSIERLELRFDDPGGLRLQQLVHYVPRGPRLYTVTLIHVAGSRFERVRSNAQQVVEALLFTGS